jgi:hypothetical protein
MTPTTIMNRAIWIMLAFWPGVLIGQQSHLVKIPARFAWPNSAESAIRANMLPKDKVRSFIEDLVNTIGPPAPRNAELQRQVPEFRFVPLETGKFYLVALTGAGVFWSSAVVLPVGGGFRYTELESDGGIPFAMQAIDLDGDGVDELVTAVWPAGYLGAASPPIYWYTIWRFRNAIPEDASAHYPDFYRRFVVGQLGYLETLLRSLQGQDPEGTRVPLAEVEYVRLKFERIVLGRTNAGLDEALTWARSKVPPLKIMGIWSLADMRSPDATQELNKLAASPVFGDLTKAALARRDQFRGTVPAP